MRRGPLATALLAIAVLPAAADDPVRDKVKAVEDQIRRAIDTAEPSIVAVVVSHSTKYPPLPADERTQPGRLGTYPRATDFLAHGRPQPRDYDPRLDLSDPLNTPDHSYGSGVVIDPDGLILTTFHLIEGATKVYVRTASGKGSYADIHAADARSDLAVLRLIDPPPGLKAIRFADVRTGPGPKGETPTVDRGMWVLTLGHPVASGVSDGSPSASWGILSGVRRRAAGPGREDQRSRALHHYSMLLQTDARITLGCSGAALLNLDGELIGLTTPMAAVTGAETAGGFAIPVDQNYRRIIDVLRAGREVEYGFLGVSVNTLSAARADGLPLEYVIPGTPAHSVGLVGSDLAGVPDVITAIDGQPVREQDDLFLYIGAALAGTKVRLSVLRDRQIRQVDVVLAKQQHDLPWIATNLPRPVHGLRVDYSSILLTKHAAPRAFPPPRVPAGVMIREIVPGSPAEARFKEIDNATSQWLITHVNGKPVTTPAEFYRAAAGQASVTLRLFSLVPGSADTDRQVRLP
jgi:serine protease Do